MKGNQKGSHPTEGIKMMQPLHCRSLVTEGIRGVNGTSVRFRLDSHHRLFVPKRMTRRDSFFGIDEMESPRNPCHGR
jgi:hypothetical protein